MNMKEFDTLDASLTLRDLSREQKKAISRLLELQIEETAQMYTAKYAAQQSVQLTAFGVGWRARLARKIISLGWWLASHGGN